MNTNGTINEPAREVPVLGDYDVVVCGGGPAGCAAAIGAARHGARTLLVEKDGFLGGATVSQLVCVLLSTNGVDFQGVWHEYIRELMKRDGVRGLDGGPPGNFRGSVDPEQVKYVWDELVTRAGAQMLLHVHAARVLEEDGKAAGIFCETRAGRRVIRARRVIDTTGDGYVAGESGVGFDQGDGAHKYAMALTMVMRMANVTKPANWPDPAVMEKLERDLRDATERGELIHPVLTESPRILGYIRGWLWELPTPRREILSVISRVLQVDPLDPWQFTAAEREGREQVRQAAHFYKTYVPGFEQSYLLDTGAQIGLRSSRRLHGSATATETDALDFLKYDDGIARSSWNIDIWPADSYTAPAVDHTSDEAKKRRAQLDTGEHFDIRYGCLVAAGIDNLLMAGRCLSAEHVAESSLRIQQTCMATGEAAGVAAALSLDANVAPRALDTAKLVASLAKDRDVEPAFECLKGLPIASKNHRGKS